MAFFFLRALMGFLLFANAALPDSKAGQLLQAFHELIANGEMGTNVPGG